MLNDQERAELERLRVFSIAMHSGEVSIVKMKSRVEQAEQQVKKLEDNQATLTELYRRERPEEYESALVQELREQLTASQAEVQGLRVRLLSAAGDDLCRLTQDEIKAMSAGAVKIPPKEEFLASCERFHAQIAKESGVLENCLTLAQLIAENERLRDALQELYDFHGDKHTKKDYRYRQAVAVAEAALKPASEEPAQ